MTLLDGSDRADMGVARSETSQSLSYQYHQAVSFPPVLLPYDNSTLPRALDLT